jgi:hypothetical protein
MYFRRVEGVRTEFIEPFLKRVLRGLGLPAASPLIRLDSRVRQFVLAGAQSLQEEARSHGSAAWLMKCGVSVTLEAYLALEYLPDEVPDLDAEVESLLPEIFREDALQSRVEELMERIDQEDIQ